MTLKGTLNELFIRNLERWSQAPKLMDTFTQRFLNSRTLPIPLATFVKRRMDSTVDEWRLTAKRETHCTGGKPHPVAPPSSAPISSSEDLQVLERQELERVHAREHKTKTQKVKTDKYVPLIFISSRSSKIRTSDSKSSADRKDRRKTKHQELEVTTEPNLPVHQTVKLGYVRAIDYRTYFLNNGSPRYDDSVSHYIPKILKKIRSQMKTHTFDPASPISVLGFLTIYKLACDANHIHEVAAM